MIIKYRNLIPALNANEFELLEANILEEGVRDSLVVWGDILVDGHNRYEIAQKHNLEFNTIQKEFANENEVKVWIIQNQLARRNLSDWQRYELTSERRKILEAEGKKNLRKATGSSKGMTLSTNDKVINTRDQIAKELNWAVGKLAQADIVNKKADIETKQRIRDNDITIHQAYSDIKKQEKKAKIIEVRKILAEKGAKKETDIDFRLGDFEEVFADIPDGSVDCIITDPPYPKEFIECWSKLSRFAKRVLKPNGFCVAYSAHIYLDEVMQRMCENLDYYWTFAMYQPGQNSIVHPRNIMVGWKPVLIFQNGFKKNKKVIRDYFISEQREKNEHDWQQSVSGVAYLIEMFTNPTDLIIDPFAGSGTTMIVAKQKGRQIKGAEIDEQTYNIAKTKI